MYVYVTFARKFRVVFFDPAGDAHVESEHDTPDAAAARVSYLNGNPGAALAELMRTAVILAAPKEVPEWFEVEMEPYPAGDDDAVPQELAILQDAWYIEQNRRRAAQWPFEWARMVFEEDARRQAAATPPAPEKPQVDPSAAGIIIPPHAH